MRLVDTHGFCKDDDIGDFAELSRLNIERQEGEGQPAFVAGIALNAEDQQQSDKKGIKNKKQSSLTGKYFNVKDSQSKVDRNTCKQAAGLNDDITGIVTAGSGGIDHYNTQNGCNDTKRQQNHVAFFCNFLDSFTQSFHALTSSTGY